MLKKIEDYINSRILLLKIEGTEKISETLSMLFRRIVLFIFAGFVVFFISIALALWIGNNCDSYVVGFLAIAGVNLLLLVLLFIFRKPLLEKHIKDEVVRTVFKEPENQK
ncbi:MAG: phage holin family protein [Bacteroidales bacterium]